MTGTKRRKSVSYPASFKQKMVAEYLQGGVSKASLEKKYKIQSKGVIIYWLREFGYSEIDKKSSSLGGFISSSLTTKKPRPEELDSTQALQQRIKELESQLEDEQLRSDGFNRMIDHAEKELNIAIRKKSDTR